MARGWGLVSSGCSGGGAPASGNGTSMVGSLSLPPRVMTVMSPSIGSLFTGRSLVFSGARQLAIGFAAAGITYGIGRLVGVTIGG